MSSQQAVYNFRTTRETDAHRECVVGRLEIDRILSQGWSGGPSLSLSNPDPAFAQATVACHQLSSSRIPTSLAHIREFKDGTILVTPHVPTDGKVSIHVVDGDYPDCYVYEADDRLGIGHGVKIRKSYGLYGEIDIHSIVLIEWYARLKYIRMPIQRIDGDLASFQSIMQQIDSGTRTVFHPSDIDEYVTKLGRETADFVKQRLQSMPDSLATVSFEGLCARLLEEAGYRVTGRNRHQGGGDVDLICERDKGDTSPFQGGVDELYAQVKKHTGKTGTEAVDQVVKMMSLRKQAPDGCVISLASFTDEARTLAADHDVILVDGDQIAWLLLRLFARRG